MTSARPPATFAMALALASAGALASESAPPAGAASAPLTPIRQFERLAGIDGSGWTPRGESATTLDWNAPDAHVTLEVVTHPGRPRRRMLDQVAAQDDWRRGLSTSGGCLLEVQVHVPAATGSGPDDTLYQLATARYPHMEMSSGTVHEVVDGYMVQATFQTDEMLGTIRLLSAERPPTGQRDTAVHEILVHRNAGRPVESRPHDPYDARFDATACHLDSDDRQWDSATPEHPLSKLRALMAQLLRQSKLPGVAASVSTTP